MIYKDRAPDGKERQVFAGKGHPRHVAGVRQDRQSAREALSRQDECSGSTRRSRAFALLGSPVSRKFARFTSTTQGRAAAVAALSVPAAFGHPRRRASSAVSPPGSPEPPGSQSFRFPPKSTAILASSRSAGRRRFDHTLAATREPRAQHAHPMRVTPDGFCGDHNETLGLVTARICLSPALTLDTEGRLVVGTGSKGKVCRSS